ncbi:WPP domain-associated protein [Benincasa hispida]|uniref:WPP domain-associated protein n=1 Tax=Benincasa hispida TaxID=102211 RepID=UPI00190255C2|nr:WPP domain-associated protein [Benincasa hispida]XP_038881887.1 WPP domain-associated protein [Benincasa hispida]
MDTNETLEENGKMQLTENGKLDDNLGDDFLEDFDSCWQDITDRLTISRMVSDSVIKGMVNAISQEAHEKITRKELEVSELKEIIHSYHLGSENTKFLASPSRPCQQKSTEFDRNDSICGALFEHDEMRESMSSLRNTAKENFRKLKKEIDRIRGCNSIRKINSGSELVGLGLSGILQEKASSRCIDVDKIVDDLQDNLDTLYKRVEGIVQLSKTSLGQWQVEQEYLADIEGMVIRNYIWSIQQEFEEKLWDQNAKILSNERKISGEKMKEISCLRQELDIISKSLSPSEVGHLISYSSMDSDHSHRKLLSNHMTSSTLHWEGNGKHEMSKTSLPENVDPSRLKHLGRDELINHFNTEMTKMSRNHESQVQEIIEENFTLKRELLKEREKSSLLKKDKEFEILRRKIPDIILKLDDILLENEKLRSSGANDENLGTMRNRLESLISENHHLKDLLGEKKKEIKCLSSQVSSHAEKTSQHSLLLSKSLNTIEQIKCEMQDAQFEASVCEDIVKCSLREMMDQIRCATEESAMRYDIMQGIYETVFEGASCIGELASTSESEHLDEESIVMQGLLGVVLQESLKEAKEKMSDLHNRYMEEMSTRLSLEKEVSHRGEALRVEVIEKERLEAELMSFRASLKEKEQLVREITIVLEKDKEKLALAYDEVGSLKDQTNRQEILILKSLEESDTTKLKLTEAMQKVGLLEVEICESKRNLELAITEFRKVDEERRMLVAMVSENQETKLLVEEKEKESRKQMESLIFVVQELLKEVFDFEHRVIDYISRNNERLGSLSSETKSLIQNASMVKRECLLYKQRLEKRCSDLQKAEEEVDLLGDEVDALLQLLEKMYIALDHYSPILKHYPGIVDILKLVKKELSGDTREAF